MKNLGAQIVPIIQSNVPPLLASYDYECNGSMTIHTKLRTTLSFHCRPKISPSFWSKFVQRTYSEGSDDRSIQSFLCRQKPVLQGETTECESDYPLHPPKLESGGCKSNGTVFVYDDLANSLS